MGARNTKPKASLLVVDDDEGLLALMSGTLEEAGYAVRGAGGGAATLKAMDASLPDLLLLDLKLKDMGGRELLRRLREAGRNVPFIVITGQGDEKVAVELMREGALDYVSKDTGLLDLLPNIVERAFRTIQASAALQAEIRERRRLEKEILEVSENEQRRIGQDLHDGLGQQLTAIEFMCQSLVGDLEKSNPQIAPRLARIAAFLREAISQTRALAHSMAKFQLDANGLRAALEELVEQAGHTGSLRAHFACPEAIVLPDGDVALQLYRITQEALQNVIRHSKAREVTVSVRRDAAGLELLISDNGIGYAARDSAGMGLRVMRHRASVAGGKLEVGPGPKGGTVVRCLLLPAP
ncbi:MAG TPA: response regulator [Lacunisphaera sp.]|nr:response regulator [Lacunisphaera sp.]